MLRSSWCCASSPSSSPSSSSPARSSPSTWSWPGAIGRRASARIWPTMSPTATMTWLWPKSTPATSPAPRASRTVVPRRPLPATVSTTAAAASSRTMLDTVPAARPVVRVSSAWVTASPRASSRTASTRWRFATRSDVAEPGTPCSTHVSRRSWVNCGRHASSGQALALRSWSGPIPRSLRSTIDDKRVTGDTQPQRRASSSPHHQEDPVAFLTRRVAIAGVALVLGATPALAACGGSPNSGGSDSTSKTIALLLPESKTTRYESFDKPLFEAKVKELCSDCKVDYYNADQDSAKQAQQVDTALGKGDEGARARPGRRQGRRGVRRLRAPVQGEGHRLRPVHRRSRLLHVVRQRDRWQAAGESLVEAMGNGDRATS